MKQYNADFWSALDKLVSESNIIIDRPKGSRHPKYHELTYPVDYGYLENTSSMDGGGIDVWKGADSNNIDAIICTLDLFKKDSEIKILIGCSEEEKRLILETHNNSEYMKGILIWRDKMETDVGTGWERDNRMHFDDIVVNYDKVRWDYPDELFADAIQYSGNGKGKRAVEIGAGTGKATNPFLDAGYAVTAVEMGANMTAFLVDKFKEYANFNVITSIFEDAPLEENRFDLIYAASAFHWVDTEIGCPKVFRLLKSGGAFVLFRNNAVPPDDGLCKDVQAVYEKYYYSHYTSNKRLVRKSKAEFMKPSEIYHGFRFESLEQYGFIDVTMKFYDAMRTYSADEYIALLDTYSDHRALPHDNRAALYAGVKEAITKHGGQQKLNFIFQLYMGRKP